MLLKAMGIYSKHIFPRILEWSLGNAMIQAERRVVLAPLCGRVLEIGFGTGLNLPFYPEAVTSLTAIDSEMMLPKRVSQRISEARFPVRQLQLDAGHPLPFNDGEFDGIVTTFTLCSIPNITSALSEIRRVLKPDGQYVFLEHGRSDDPKVARRQDQFNPIEKFIGCGCNVNRPIDQLILAAKLQILTLDRYLMTDTPRIFGEMYRGIAGKG